MCHHETVIGITSTNRTWGYACYIDYNLGVFINIIYNVAKWADVMRSACLLLLRSRIVFTEVFEIAGVLSNTLLPPRISGSISPLHFLFTHIRDDVQDPRR